MKRAIRDSVGPDVRSERGAILIFVGLAVLMLTAFSAFVLDYGVMWLSRRQAQNAADAGALAGVISRVYDEPTAPGPLTTAAALGAVSVNPVFGEPGGAIVDVSDDACPDWATGGACVRVDVFRDGTNASNVLPAYFANLFNVTSQSVRATATAQVRYGNAAECAKPFGVADFYTEPVENYVSPGFTLEGDPGLGSVVTIKGGPHSQLSPGWFQLLDLPIRDDVGHICGGACGERAMTRSCITEVVAIGDELEAQPGNEASIRFALQDLIDLDLGASWNGEEVVGSCADSGTCQRYNANGDLEPDPNRSYSPRTMALPVFDPLEFATTGRIEVVNIFGFFLQSVAAPSPPDFEVTGTLVSQPALVSGGGGEAPEGAEFLHVIQLIR